MATQAASHPAHVRIAHWINALTVLVLLWTGFSMFSTDRHFAAIVRALPPWLFTALQLRGHGPAARAWHLAFALVLIANAVWYGVSSLRSGSWRRIVPQGRTWLSDAVRDTIAELRGPQAAMERANYNGAQKLAYSGVMALGAVLIVTGVALWFGRQLPWLIRALGGQRIVLPVHVVVATLLLAFIAIHLVQVARAGLPTLFSMIVGSSDARPRAARRAFAFSGAALAAVVAGFTVLRATGGPAGVPPYLQWAVERKPATTQHAHMHRRHIETNDAG